MLKSILIMLFPLFVMGQKIHQVTYTKISNGETAKSPTVMLYQKGIAYASKPTSKVQNYIDFNAQNISSVQKFNEVYYKTVTAFNALPKPEFLDKSETILGHACKYAKYIYFSNTVEVWYTEKAKIKGSPYTKFLPTKDALVLKIVINGNRKITATKIEKIKIKDPLVNLTKAAKQVTKAEFEELKINSRFIQLSVFENQILNYEPDIKNATDTNLELGKIYRYNSGSIVLKKIKLTPKMKKSGFVFVKVTEKSNGDAYDRTGTVFIIPNTDKKTLLDALSSQVNNLPEGTTETEKAFRGFIQSPTSTPVIELMRFFTPFGAGYFNDKRPINNYNWAKEVVYEQEVSQVFPLQADEVIIGVNIGNYDKGGHLVDVVLNFYPKEEYYSNTRNFIQPLFNSVNPIPLKDQNYSKQFKKEGLTVAFEVPEKVSDLELIYTVTGHGGWDKGDEFVKRINQLYLNGKEIFNITPWRSDCATYRMLNPASGNFASGLSSSDYSRSNWCPGTVTNPYYISLANLKPGKHTLHIKINQGEDVDGGNNYWGISGILVGNREQ